MAPRPTSEKASKASLTSRTTRSRRATSQPVSATACSSTTTNRIQKPRAQSVTSQVRTRRATSVSSVQSAVVAKPTKNVAAAQPVAIPARSSYGDAHASREYQGMLAYAKAVHKAGTVDEETLEKMCRPWQEKGVLEMKWKEEYLLEGVEETEEIMDLKKAEAIARKKDAAEKKYLAEYFGGGGKSTVEKGHKKKEPLKTVSSGRISKTSSSSSSKKSSSKLPIIVEDEDEDESEDAPTPPSKPASAAQFLPLPGRPDYAEYNYYQLASICYERNLVSGGKADILRYRLIQDDINVIQDLPREAKQYSKEKLRGRKNKAPVVPNAPQAPPAVYVKTATKDS